MGRADIDNWRQRAIVDPVGKFLTLATRIGNGLVALGLSVLTGATLAVVVVEGRLSALPSMVWRAGWILRGRPLAPGEADADWMLEIEWRMAFVTAILVAALASMLWGILSWRRLQSQRAAASIGFVLCTIAAGLWFHNGDDISLTTILTMLIGLVGALCGWLTYAMDKVLVRRFS